MPTSTLDTTGQKIYLKVSSTLSLSKIAVVFRQPAKHPEKDADDRDSTSGGSIWTKPDIEGLWQVQLREDLKLLSYPADIEQKDRLLFEVLIKNVYPKLSDIFLHIESLSPNYPDVTAKALDQYFFAFLPHDFAIHKKSVINDVNPVLKRHQFLELIVKYCQSINRATDESFAHIYKSLFRNDVPQIHQRYPDRHKERLQIYKPESEQPLIRNEDTLRRVFSKYAKHENKVLQITLKDLLGIVDEFAL